MITVTIRPTATAYNDSYTVVGAATAHEAVNEETLDMNSYIQSSASGSIARFNIAVPTTATYARVTVHVIKQSADTGNVRFLNTSAVVISGTKVLANGVTESVLAFGWFKTALLADALLYLQANASNRLYQVYATVEYIDPLLTVSSAALVPNADTTIALTKSTGSTNYGCIDETPENESDYVYCPANYNRTDIYGLSDPAANVQMGTPQFLIIRFRKYSDLGGSSRVDITINDGGTTLATINCNTTLYDDAGLVSNRTGTWDTYEFLVELPAGEKVWSKVAGFSATLAIQTTTATAPTTQCAAINITVVAEMFDYFGANLPNCLPKAGSIVFGSIILGAGAPTLAFKRLEVSDSSTFGTTLLDTGELAATDEAGGTVTIASALTFATVGTYYLRFGVRSSADPVISWSQPSAFVVSFPSVVSFTITSDGCHARITAVINDTYADAPLLMAHVDGQAIPMRLV